MHTQTPTSTLFPYTTLFRSLRLQTARGASPVTVRSAPSPEVTVPFCLVPSPEFSQAPWYSLLDLLCRFRVRFLFTCSLEAFLGSMASTTSRYQYSDRRLLSYLRSRIYHSSINTFLYVTLYSLSSL